MDANEHRQELNKITDKIIECAYKISNKLGIGFLEKVYENEIDNIHITQYINYLKAVNLKLCLLINFGKTREKVKLIATVFKKIVFICVYQRFQNT